MALVFAAVTVVLAEAWVEVAAVATKPVRARAITKLRTMFFMVGLPLELLNRD